MHEHFKQLLTWQSCCKCYIAGGVPWDTTDTACNNKFTILMCLINMQLTDTKKSADYRQCLWLRPRDYSTTELLSKMRCGCYHPVFFFSWHFSLNLYFFILKKDILPSFRIKILNNNADFSIITITATALN